jgi:hypothetical protein
MKTGSTLAFLAAISLSTWAAPSLAKDPGELASYKAINFLPAARLTQDQHRILTTYLERPDTSIVPGLDHSVFRGVDSDFDEWHQSYDGKAATFMAITHTLSVTTFHLAHGQDIRAIDVVKDLKKTLGDRLIVTLNKVVFDQWQAAGGNYTFHLANGKTETGKIQINPGGGAGGSLHQGYDRQGYTSTTKVPRMQINYRDNDSEADIDLDGYQPFKLGFIPNPNHLTWENSDVRYWFRSYVKKFGDPGFEVSKR